jgi:hypothetical protein
VKTHLCEQRSPEWYALRAGMPTASAFSSLITSTGELSKSLAGYALTLAAEKFAGRTIETFEGTAWMERGREIEDEAIRCYQFAADCDVEPVGFITDDELRMGCSPDGLVGSDGMVEAKCLKAENHIKAILYFQKHGHCQPEYVQQTQGQIMIGERKWCDLVFFHPDLPLLTIRQFPEPKLHAALRLAIDQVIQERATILHALRKQGPSALETAA